MKKEQMTIAERPAPILASTLLPAVRVLNLYAGIGGNRKLWEDVEVTSVEYREDIADVYRHYFPGDPETGLHIFNYYKGIMNRQTEQASLFTEW